MSATDAALLMLIKIMGCVTTLALLCGGFVWAVDRCLHTKPLWVITWRVLQEYWREQRQKEDAGK